MSLYPKKKYELRNTDEMLLSERREAIRALEEERLKITAEIEELMRRTAKLAGRPKLYKRKRRVGSDANDWKPARTYKI